MASTSVQHSLLHITTYQKYNVNNQLLLVHTIKPNDSLKSHLKPTYVRRDSENISDDIFVECLTWPTPSLIVAAIFVFHKVVFRLGIGVHCIAVVLLEVGVHDNHHLTTFRRKLANHLLRFGKFVICPSKISVKIFYKNNKYFKYAIKLV